MKQKCFTIGVDLNMFEIEPAEKVNAFAKRLNDAMRPIRRDVRKKLIQSKINASKRIVL